MKINTALLIIFLASLLAGCNTMGQRQNTKAQPPVNLKIGEYLNINMVDGRPHILDAEGNIISKRVKMPIDISNLKTIENIQELLIIKMRGSCDYLIGAGGEYSMVELPDNHPLCQALYGN